MNKHLSHVFLICLAVFFFSCQDDDDVALKAPIISGFEFGQGSTHSTDPVAYKGSDLHLEAEILAEATVSAIRLEIHGHGLTLGEAEEEWDFDRTYTDAKYLVKNPSFHEHVDIPARIPAGEYHVTLSVTDEAGNTSEAEGDLLILDRESQ